MHDEPSKHSEKGSGSSRLVYIVCIVTDQRQ